MRASYFLYAGATALAVVATVGLSTSTTQAVPPQKPKVPVLQVDPSWPKALPVAGDFGTPPAISTATGKPKPWVTGEVAGTCVDSQDNVFTVNRGNLISPETVEAVPPPTVIEYNPAGDVVAAWNVQAKDATGTLVPVNQAQIHGCFVDYQDNIWIAGNGEGVVVKYSHDGSTWLNQIGVYGPGGTSCDNPPANLCGNSGSNPAANQSTTLLNEPANVWVDPGVDPQSGQHGAVYVADGYGNHRVVVFQDNGNGTVTYLRQWGGVAGTVDDPLTDYTTSFAAGDGGHPHCVVGGNDGYLYVCDRADDRIQVFTKTGDLVRIIPVVPGTGQTLGIGGAAGLGTAGSAWDLRFTNDPTQSYMFEIDGGNEIMHTMDRMLGSIVSDLGRPGHAAGEFTFLHSNTVDSKGNVYTGETINGRRIQKFVHVECNNGNGKGNGNGNCS
jgi:hypothetical protein